MSLICSFLALFVVNKKHYEFERAILLPKYQKIFDGIGENIKLARKRRKLTTSLVAKRANIHRATLYRVEKGDPSVAIGIYFNVFKILNLEKDFSKLAADDVFGRKLQDLKLFLVNFQENN